jgi:hypothetical protein
VQTKDGTHARVVRVLSTAGGLDASRWPPTAHHLPRSLHQARVLFIVSLSSSAQRRQAKDPMRLNAGGRDKFVRKFSSGLHELGPSSILKSALAVFCFPFFEEDSKIGTSNLVVPYKRFHPRVELAWKNIKYFAVSLYPRVG